MDNLNNKVMSPAEAVEASYDVETYGLVNSLKMYQFMIHKML